MDTITLLKKAEKSGYIKVYCPEHPYSEPKGGWVLEHRFMVENFIGRKLKASEVIHHIDEDKTNNEIDNLMIFQSNKDHSSWHNKLKRVGMTNPMKQLLRTRWKEFGK